MAFSVHPFQLPEDPNDAAKRLQDQLNSLQESGLAILQLVSQVDYLLIVATDQIPHKTPPADARDLRSLAVSKAETYLHTHIQHEIDAVITAEDLVSQYQAWCRKLDLPHLHDVPLGRLLRKVFPEVLRKPTFLGGKRRYGYYHISFKPNPADS